MSYATVVAQLPKKTAPTRSVSDTRDIVNVSSLLEHLNNAVQQVQTSTACSSTCEGHPLTNGNKEVTELCRVLNGFLSFGLVRKSDSYWPVVKEVTPKNHVDEVLRIWQPRTAKGRALSWLYQSLNDGTLEWQMRSLLDNHSLLSKYYTKNAYILDKQTLEMVSMFLRGLDGVQISLQPRQQRRSSEGLLTNGCARTTQCSKSRSSDAINDRNTDGSCKLRKNVDDKPYVNVSQSKSSKRHSSVALFEQSVADFSSCPEVLGLSKTDADLLLIDAELCQEALSFRYPEISRPWLGAPSFVVRKKKLLPSKQCVPKIVETNDATGLSSMENSMSEYQLPSIETEMFNSKEPSCSTPLTQTDADAMFREIIKGRRRQSPEGSDSLYTTATFGDESSGKSKHIEVQSMKLNSTGLVENPASGFTTTSESNTKVEWEDNICKKTSDSMEIVHANGGTHKHEDFTLTPPNTFVPSSAIPVMNGDRQRDGMPRVDSLRSYTDFEQQILNRLEKVFVDRSGNFGEEKSSENSEVGSMKKEIVNGHHGPDEDSIVAEVDSHSSFTQSGEVFLESGEVLELTVNVMKEGEQFYKMFRVYVNFHLGTPSVRYLVLTNYTFYLLIQESANEAIGAKYVNDFRIPYRNIEYISVGLNAQIFSVYLKQTRQCLVVCTASDLITSSILSNLELAVRRASTHEATLHPPSVLTDATPQRICLNKWISGEIGRENNQITLYSLVYWNPDVSTKVGTPSGGANRHGYLYMREFYPNGWLTKSTDWEQSYFMLRGKKFYQFEDLSCKFGKRVFNLQDEVVGCRQTETTEHTYCVELILQDDSVIIQLACPTKHELQQWLHAFVASFSQAETAQTACSCLACTVILTNHFILLGQETTTVGFVRTLAISRLDALFGFKMSTKSSDLIVTVPSANGENGEQWLLSFSCNNELTKFVNTLKSLIGAIEIEELDNEIDGENILQEGCDHWVNNLKHNK